MRDSIGTSWLFGIVILFLLLFTSIMSITINRSKAYAVKDEIVAYIENNNGTLIHELDNGLDNKIEDIMREASYRSEGTCPDESYDGYDRDGEFVNNNEPSICIKKFDASGSDDGISNGKSCYYQIIVFYRLDIPVMKQIFNFSLIGETKILTGCGGA